MRWTRLALVLLSVGCTPRERPPGVGSAASGGGDDSSSGGTAGHAANGGSAGSGGAAGLGGETGLVGAANSGGVGGGGLGGGGLGGVGAVAGSGDGGAGAGMGGGGVSAGGPGAGGLGTGGDVGGAGTAGSSGSSVSLLASPAKTLGLARGTVAASDRSPAVRLELQGAAVGCVPGGTFTLGHAEAPDATPLQPDITVGRFVVDAMEVTVARFRTFWDAGAPHAHPAAVTYPDGTVITTDAPVVAPLTTTDDDVYNWTFLPADREDWPINKITWSTAMHFCIWNGGCLPTEAEWEFLTRYRDTDGLDPGREYPRGNNAASCALANGDNCIGFAGRSPPIRTTVASTTLPATCGSGPQTGTRRTRVVPAGTARHD